MQLKLLTVIEASALLHAGEVVAYPTEAVYGLGCDPWNEKVVRRIIAMKGRPVSDGLILIGDRYEQFLPFIAPVSEGLRMRAMSVWPGPVTWLFPRGENVPDWLAGRHATVALRLTAHPVCRDLCAAFGGAIVSTSANPRAADPARSSDMVETYFDDQLAGIVAGGLGDDLNPSEIRDLATATVVRKA